MIAYLLATHPAPRLGVEPPVALDRFLEACGPFVGDERSRDLERVVRGPGGGAVEDPQVPMFDPAAAAWATAAGLVEEAIVQARVARSRRELPTGVRVVSGHRVDVVEGVAAAFELPDPGARERALDELRWRLAEELSVAEPDGFGALVARTVQLRLAWRWARWDAEEGRRALEAALRRIEEEHG